MSTLSLAEINAQIKQQEEQLAQLKASAEAQRKEEIASVIQVLRAKITEYGISAKELGLGAAKAKQGRRATLAESIVKGTQYKGPNGEIWTSGTRGRKPGWLTAELANGKTLEELAA